MLAPDPASACSSFLKARIAAFLHTLGLQGFFFLSFVPSLPTVMDPLSVTIGFYSSFIFCTFTMFHYCQWKWGCVLCAMDSIRFPFTL